MLLVGAMAAGSTACTDGSVGQDPCEGRECGIAEGKDCGSCPLVTEACTDQGQCVDLCAGRDCGPVEGGTCGTCAGDTEVCDDLSGRCVDVCAQRECGEPVEGFSCGQCTGSELCGLPGRCFVPGGCPSGMIELGLTGVCIDAFEVTCSQMAEFINVHTNECRIEGFTDWNERYRCYEEGVGDEFGLSESSGHWQVRSGYQYYPIVSVTYVGARLACEHWGKRLCSMEDWAEGCEGPEEYVYPYGDTYDPYICNACNDSQTEDCPTGDPTVVGGYPGCEGGYPGLFDMCGNVAEWVMDYYEGPFNTIFHALGGYAGQGSSSTCRHVYSSANSPYRASPEVGFRCCYYLD